MAGLCQERSAFNICIYRLLTGAHVLHLKVIVSSKAAILHNVFIYLVYVFVYVWTYAYIMPESELSIKLNSGGV